MKKIWIQKSPSLKSLVAQHWLQTAWCLVGLKKPWLTQTHRHITHMCSYTHNILFRSRIIPESGHRQNYVGRYAQNTYTNMHTLITTAHVFVQVSDCSWGVHERTAACMQWSVTACPDRLQCMLTHRVHMGMCTLTICQWISMYQRKKGREFAHVSLDYVLGKDQEILVPVFFHITVLSLIKTVLVTSFTVSLLLPQAQTIRTHQGHAPAHLFFWDFSILWKGWNVFSSDWSVDSWWQWKKEERRSWSW